MQGHNKNYMDKSENMLEIDSVKKFIDRICRMTLRKSGNLKAIECDSPGCTRQWGTRFHPPEIRSHVKLALLDGWQSFRTKKGWCHRCPDHAKPDPVKQPAVPYKFESARYWWMD